MELSNNYRISSIQSKFIKFLQFDKNKINWSPGQSIIYFDHKFKVLSRHIIRAQEICNSSILIRNTPREKLTIEEEIRESIVQERYKESMEETKKWIEKKIKFEKYTNFNRIMNTGFIFYKDIVVII